jgi:hypothetical protein
VSLKVSWDTQLDAAVILKSEGICSFAEFYEAVDQAHALIASADYPVDLIVWHEGTFPPGNILFHFSKAMKDQPLNTGLVVVVNSTMKPYLMKLADIVERVLPTKSKTKIAGSIEEAHDILSVYRAKAVQVA